MEGTLLGVDAEGVPVVALTLRLPGAVIDPFCEYDASRRGVLGAGLGVPSLLTGLPRAEDGREAEREVEREAGCRGGGIELSAPKKLDLRRTLPPAGDEGS